MTTNRINWAILIVCAVIACAVARGAQPYQNPTTPKYVTGTASQRWSAGRWLITASGSFTPDFTGGYDISASSVPPRTFYLQQPQASKLGDLIFLCDGCAYKWRMAAAGMLPAQPCATCVLGGEDLPAPAWLPAAENTYDGIPSPPRKGVKYGPFLDTQAGSAKWSDGTYTSSGTTRTLALAKPAPQADDAPKTICGTNIIGPNAISRHTELIQVTCPDWAALAKIGALPVPSNASPQTQVLIHVREGRTFVAEVDGWEKAEVLRDLNFAPGLKGGMIVFDGNQFKTLKISVQEDKP